MKVLFKKLIVLLLVLGMTITPNMGVLVNAAINILLPNEENVTEEVIKNVEKVELTHLRKENLKVYLLPNNTLEYEYYKEPIHYFDGSTYQEIVTEIKEYDNKYVGINPYYEVVYSKELTNDSSIQININDEYKIEWKYLEVNNAIGKKLSDNIKYEDVFIKYKNVDIEFYQGATTFKENIVLNEYSKNFSFSYLLNIEDLELTEENKKYFIKDEDTIIYEVTPLFMYDANNVICNEVEVDVTKIDEGLYQFTVWPSDVYLSNANTKYPVVIDPIVEVVQEEYECTVESKTYFYTGTVTDPYSTIAMVGNPTWETNGIFSIMKLNISNNQFVDFSSAEVVFNLDSSYGYLTMFSIYRLNTQYDFEDIYSQNINGIGKTYLAGSFYTNPEVRIPYSNIFINNTTTALLYFSPDGGEGFAEIASDANRPVIRISNIICKNPGELYDEVDLGSAGTAKVNVATGELIYQVNDIELLHENNPFSIYHIYNSINNNELTSYGKGWNINYQETIEKEGVNYKLTTSEGHEIYFVKPSSNSSEYIDEKTYLSVDSKGYKLVVQDELNGIYLLYRDKISRFERIENDSSNKSYQVKIMESLYIDNGINIDYEKINDKVRILQIQDSAGNEANFVYGANQLLIELNILIQNYNGETKTEKIKSYSISYVYDDSKLIKKQKAYWNQTEENLTSTIASLCTNIMYNENDLIETIYHGDITNYELGKKFTYTINGEVSSYVTYSPDQKEYDDVVNLYYYENKTKKVMNNTYQRYWFDIYGNVIKIDNNELSSEYYVYENTSVNQHNLINSYTIYSGIINYLKDPYYRLSTTWQAYISANAGDIYKEASSLTPGASHVVINKTSEDEIYYYQDILLNTGQYYLVAPIKNTSTNSGACVEITNLDDNQNLDIVFTTKEIKATNEEYEEYVVQLEVKSAVNVRVKLQGAEDTNTYFENIFLGKWGTYNKNNLVENSSFEIIIQNELTNWEGSYLLVDNETDNDVFGDNHLVVFESGIKQTILTSGVAGDIYQFSAWVLPSYYDDFVKYGSFEYRITMNYTDATSEDFVLNSTYLYEMLDEGFNFDNNYLDFTATKDYASIEIEIKPLNHEAMKVDNISLVKTQAYVESQTEDETTSGDTDVENNDINYLIYDLPSIEEITLENRYLIYDRYNEYLLFTSESKAEITPDEYEELAALVTAADNLGSLEYKPKHKISEDTVGYGGQYILSKLESIYGQTIYSYEIIKNRVSKETKDDVVTTYYYDSFNRLIKRIMANNDDATAVDYDSDIIEYEYDVLDRVVKIILSNVEYRIEYTNQNNIKALYIDNNIFVAYEYQVIDGIETSNITKCTYASGYVLEYEYDALGNVILTKTGTTDNLVDTYRYEYSFEGLLIKVIDIVNNYTYKYEYDSYGNIEKSIDNFGNVIEYISDYNNTITMFDIKYTETSNTNEDDKTIIEYTGFDYLFEQQEVEGINTQVSKIMIESLYITRTITLNDNLLISKISYGDIQFEYEYNKENISSIRKTIYDKETNLYTIIEELYEYNYRKELIKHQIYKNTSSDISTNIKEDSNKKYECLYTYDDSSNLLTINRTVKLEEYSNYETFIRFTYNRNNLASKIIRTSSDETIDNIVDTYTYLYDSDFNMIEVYKNNTLYKSFAYKSKNMVEYREGNKIIKYYYDESERRYQKEIYIVNELNEQVLVKKHQYAYNNDLLVAECIIEGEVKTNLYYFYNENDELLGFRLNNSNNYYYMTNHKKDVIGIIDSSGNIIVNYTYDAYGNIISIVGNEQIGLLNPIRYKSYYYDTETTLYYCTTRYYDSSIVRFTTSDEAAYILLENDNLNLFTYCNNNPINYVDPEGTDALYFAFLDLLPVVGHAGVAVEGEIDVNDGIKAGWFYIEFSVKPGHKVKKRNAAVMLHGPFDTEEEVKKKMQKWYKTDKRQFVKLETIKIPGNFQKSLTNILKYVDLYYDKSGLEQTMPYWGDIIDYKKYFVFTNNCLHFAKKILRDGDITDDLMRIYINGTVTIVPNIFYNSLLQVSSYTKNWRGKLKVYKLILSLL